MTAANRAAIRAGERAKAETEEAQGRAMCAQPSLWACPECHVAYALTGGIQADTTEHGWDPGTVCGGCLVKRGAVVSLVWVRALEEVGL